MTRVLFVAGGSYFAGQERLNVDLMAALKARGVAVCGTVSTRSNGIYAAELAAHGVSVSKVTLGRFYVRKPLWTLDSAMMLPRGLLTLRRLVASFRPAAVVMANLSAVRRASWVLPAETPLIFHAHDRPAAEFSANYIGGAVTRISGIIAVSEFIAAQFRDVLGADKPVVVAHNGTFLGQSVPNPVAAGGRVSFGIVGQLIPSKRHVFLFEAVSRLDLQTRRQLRVLVFGSGRGEEERQLRVTAEKMGVLDVVEFRGFVQSRDEIYRETDVLIACSVAEPFGLTVIEAAAWSRPAITARAGGFLETVQDGVTGLLFDPDSPENLAACMTRLLAKEARLEFGCAARRRAEAEFSTNRMAQSFVEALRTIGVGAANTPSKRSSLSSASSGV